MWTFVCVKNTLHPASQLLSIEINELCVSPCIIWPYIYFGGSCGNSIIHSLVDIIVPQFGSTTLVGGLLDVFVFIWVAWLDEMSTLPVSDMNVSGSTVISRVDPTDLT